MSVEDSHYGVYEKLVCHLKRIIEESNQRIIRETPDGLLKDNVNFFTKAYLISLCTYLEAFQQDIAWTYVNLVKNKIAAAKIPSNVVRWFVTRDVKEKDLSFEYFTLSLLRADLEGELSGNPAKTIALFRKIGIDLQSSDSFKKHKEEVGRIVAKRNNIIHHNDNATDVSMSDLIGYADSMLIYMKAIQKCIFSSA